MMAMNDGQQRGGGVRWMTSECTVVVPCAGREDLGFLTR